MVRLRIAPAAGLLLISVSAYAPTVGGDFLLDDNVYIPDNPALRTPAGLRQIWLQPGSTPQYYPLVFTTYWVEYHLWGLSPPGYHVVNILLHAANAVLLWHVLQRLSVPGAWFVAALFAVHPVQTESVGWIQERKNVLSGLFYLTAALAYLRYALPEAERPEPVSAASPTPTARIDRRGMYVVALIAGCCAFLSKTVP